MRIAGTSETKGAFEIFCDILVISKKLLESYNEFDEIQQNITTTQINELKTEFDNKKDKLLENCQKSWWDTALTVFSVLFILAGIATITKPIIMYNNWEDFSKKDVAFTIIDTFFTVLITAYLATKFSRDSYDNIATINIHKAKNYTKKSKQKALTIICNQFNNSLSKEDDIEEATNEAFINKYNTERITQLLSMYSIFSCVSNNTQSIYRNKVESIRNKLKFQSDKKFNP